MPANGDNRPMKPAPSNAAERRDYYDRIRPLHLTPLWESLHALVPREPQTPCVPALCATTRSARC